MVHLPELTVCGIEELPDHRARAVTHVLSILDPDRADPEVFTDFGTSSRIIIRFHDIIASAPGRVMPAREHVEAILAFGAEISGRREDAGQNHVLVHCHMGVSRSTAAMVTLMAQANPQESAQSLFARLTAIRPHAWPNSKMISFADDLLSRRGEMKAELARHYGRQIRTHPYFIDWMTELGRRDEIEMAIFD